MEKDNWQCYTNAAALPARWDEIARDNFFLQRKQLAVLQEVNPCQQRYYLHSAQGVCFVRYRLKVDVLSYLPHLSWRWPLQIIGIPLSVSAPGYAMASEDAAKRRLLGEYIKQLPGTTLLLNGGSGLPLPGGATLPSFLISLKWPSFAAYLASLRSSYRYRFSKALKRGSNLQVSVLPQKEGFDLTLYRLYQEVYENSSFKLEQQPLEFFRRFPGEILVIKEAGKTIAFAQLAGEGGRLYFVLGGFCRQRNKEKDLYLNLLLAIVRYGIDGGYTSLDLGQTADASKSAIGGAIQPKTMYLSHALPRLNGVLRLVLPIFSHRPYSVCHRTFRGED